MLVSVSKIMKNISLATSSPTFCINNLYHIVLICPKRIFMITVLQVYHLQ